jgi:hypothetical protein
MNRLIPFLIGLAAFSHYSMAQSRVSIPEIFPSSGVWVNTDGTLTLGQLTRRNPLLEVRVKPNDPALVDLAHHLTELQSRFPFLNIIGTMACSEAYQLETEEIHRTLRHTSWTFPMYSYPEVAPLDSSQDKGYRLYGIHALQSSKEGSITEISAFEKTVNQWIADQNGLQNIPHSYISRIESGLIDLQLLLNPSGIAVDPEYDFLFISDTDHHRIFLCNTDGRILETIGTGKAGNIDGRPDETMFSYPSGLGYDKVNRILYIADRGNNAIRSFNIDERSIRTLVLVDEEERLFQLPAPISDIDFHDGHLTIACPGAQSFWKVDLTNFTTVRVHGSLHMGSQISKNPLKTELLSASGHARINNLDFYLDMRAGRIYSSDNARSNLILCQDSVVALEKKAMYDPEIHGLTALTAHEGRLVCWSTKSKLILEIDPFSYTISPLPVDTGQVLPKSVSDMVSIGDQLYILDPISSMVFALKGRKMERVLFKERNRALHLENPADLFLPLDAIQLAASGQNSIRLLPIIPPHFALDPSTESNIHVSDVRSGTISIEGTLNQGDLTLFVFPEVKLNQINLMAEVNFCDKTDPWSCYQRWVTINIPILLEGGETSPKALELELLKGL